MDSRRDAAVKIRVGRLVVTMAKKRTRIYEFANEAVHLTCGGHAEAVPTRDPFDMAHGVRDGFGMLVPAAIRREGHIVLNRLVRHARPRRYHPSQMTSSGVGVDSMFDAWWESVKRLAYAGVLTTAHADHARALEAAESSARSAGIRLRDILHQRTRQDLTPEETAAEREASRILRAAGVEDDG